MKQFKTESKRLLDLTINSIYTNHEIFLRELISNASDALDKLAVKAFSQPSVPHDNPCIRIAFDVKSRMLRISDNGIGMDADALEQNLGTIAYSGSRAYKESALLSDNDGDNIAGLIGQFGIGFYSAFMVADRVKVISRAFGSSEANSWESSGVEGYTITPAVRSEHGTDVILHIRKSTIDENLERYLDALSIEGIVKRYSNYIRYPIILEQPDNNAESGGTREEKPHILNSMVPLWTRNKNDVDTKTYNEFYRSEFNDENDPLRVISTHAEGTLCYDALLFIPRKNPKNPFGTDIESGLRLYSSNVMVNSCCKELLPSYFGFVRGLVDSRDIPLNVSRETMQEIGRIETIGNHIKKKIAHELVDIRENDRESYIVFFREFGSFFKHAITTSYGTLTEELHDFLLFYSARLKKPITLAEYASASPDGDRGNIYYATGDDIERLAHTPSVEAVLAGGRDVLLCPGSVGDEMCFMTMGSYKGANFCNVATAKGGIADDKTRDEASRADADYRALLEALSNCMPSEVTKVVASTRLTKPTQAAACVVTEGPVTIAMARFLATRTTHKGASSSAKVTYTLELNVNHMVFSKVKKAYETGDKTRVANYAKLLLGEALLAEDVRLADPFAFCTAINSLL